jgi:hypothetical protein
MNLYSNCLGRVSFWGLTLTQQNQSHSDYTAATNLYTLRGQKNKDSALEVRALNLLQNIVQENLSVLLKAGTKV